MGYEGDHIEVFGEAAMIGYVRRSIGEAGTDKDGNLLGVAVEISDEQVKDAINDAMAFYNKYKPRRVTEAWTAPSDINQHTFTTKGVRGIAHMDAIGINEGIASPNIEAQMLSGTYAYYGVKQPQYDLRYYEYLRQWVKIASRELSSEFDYHLAQDGPQGTSLSVWTYSPGRPCRVTATITVSHADLSTIPEHEQTVLRSYVLGDCLMKVGRIRSKFASILGANKDLALDGAARFEEGKEKVEKAQEKIEKTRAYRLPEVG